MKIHKQLFYQKVKSHNQCILIRCCLRELIICSSWYIGNIWWPNAMTIWFQQNKRNMFYQNESLFHHTMMCIDLCNKNYNSAVDENLYCYTNKTALEIYKPLCRTEHWTLHGAWLKSIHYIYDELQVKAPLSLYRRQLFPAVFPGVFCVISNIRTWIIPIWNFSVHMMFAQSFHMDVWISMKSGNSMGTPGEKLSLRILIHW